MTLTVQRAATVMASSARRRAQDQPRDSSAEYFLLRVAKVISISMEKKAFSAEVVRKRTKLSISNSLHHNLVDLHPRRVCTEPDSNG